MKIELTVGELKELFFNESSTNRIKPSSNESPFVPSKKTIKDFKKIAKKEYKNLLKGKSRKEDKEKFLIGESSSESSLENKQKPMPHEDFVKMGKDILDANHKHRPGRPRKAILT